MQTSLIWAAAWDHMDDVQFVSTVQREERQEKGWEQQMRLFVSTHREGHQLTWKYEMGDCVRRETWLGHFRATGEGLGNEEIAAAIRCHVCLLQSFVLKLFTQGETEHLRRQAVPTDIPEITNHKLAERRTPVISSEP